MDSQVPSTLSSLNHPAPSAGGSTFEPLAANARRAMRLGWTLGLGILAVPSCLVAFAFLAKFGVDGFERAGLLLLLAIALLLFGWWYGGARWRHAGVALDERGIAIRRGVWWRSETFVPRSRVQHTDINRGPIDRWLGLATLKLYTAGTRLASVETEGLENERAIALRDALVSRDDDAV